MEFFAIVGVIVTVWFAVAVLAGRRHDAPPRPPPPTDVAATYGQCPRCSWVGQLHDGPGLTVCHNCAVLWLRGNGTLPELADLSPGTIIGTCRGCGRRDRVALTDSSVEWLCATCFGAVNARLRATLENLHDD
jgi:hypothetical protein